jgi:hypothetical protein
MPIAENGIHKHSVPEMPIVIYEEFIDLSIEKVLLLQLNQGVRPFGDIIVISMCLKCR